MFSKDSSKVQPLSSAPVSPVHVSSMPSIISADLTVHGDLVCRGDLQIEGSVEGDVKGRNLTLGEAGMINGTVEAETVQISGSLRGKIKARSVTLEKTAQVFGDINYDNMIIEAGACLNGMCKPMGSNRL